MTLSLTSKQVITKLKQNVQRVDNRVNNYIKDANENNIHDIRTAIRRIDPSFRVLPKKIRKKSEISKYQARCKKLFKINSQIRDYDIICERLEKYSSDPTYPNLTDLLKRKRKTKLIAARKIALSLTHAPVSHITENDISTKKSEIRFDKLVKKFRERIEFNLPIVLTNVTKIKELHELRKDCKKLRYLLELLPYQNNHHHNTNNDSKQVQKMITELEDIQGMIGSIHDSDTTISYLRRVRQHSAVRHILDKEILEKNKKYEEFVQFCKRSLSNSRNNFLNHLSILA
jgi:CHAD domain-containing protein